MVSSPEPWLGLGPRLGFCIAVIFVRVAISGNCSFLFGRLLDRAPKGRIFTSVISPGASDAVLTTSGPKKRIQVTGILTIFPATIIIIIILPRNFLSFRLTPIRSELMTFHIVAGNSSKQ
ncbi:hypothetical protein BYT27DRAFT_7203476 [Phlegmacium glaucopus]|nr:hypothetical protein BYT27DRAFT_7203476 [Phlegmacium glaucopus]